MPIYCYQHPKTKEVFESIRPVKDRKKLYTAPDGKKCKWMSIPPSLGYMGLSAKEREVFELYREDVKACQPKRVKFRDGHVEKYDPTRHC